MVDRTAEPSDGGPCENTDRHLWPDMAKYDAPHESIHVTAQGGIGINVAGCVYVKTLREWHNLAGGTEAFSIRHRSSKTSDERKLQAFDTLAAFYTKHAIGPKTLPSCLVCGRTTAHSDNGIQHLELPGIVVCVSCAEAARRAPETAAPREVWCGVCKTQMREIAPGKFEHDGDCPGWADPAESPEKAPERRLSASEEASFEESFARSPRRISEKTDYQRLLDAGFKPNYRPLPDDDPPEEPSSPKASGSS